MSNTDLAAAAFRHPFLTGVTPAVTWRLAQLSEKPNYWSQTPLRPSTKVAGKPVTGRCRIGARPRAGQGPVWAVPEESVDEGGGSVTVTVTVSGGAVTVSGGVVTVTGAGTYTVEALLVTPVSPAGAGSIAV